MRRSDSKLNLKYFSKAIYANKRKLFEMTKGKSDKDKKIMNEDSPSKPNISFFFCN